MKIIKLIKILIFVFIILAGVNIYFSFRATEANSEKVMAYGLRREFTLAGHEFRTASLEITRSARAFIVKGNERQLELYWEYLLVVDRLGAVRQMFIDSGASPSEIELLDRALAYQGKLRAIDALAIEARAAGDNESALKISYSPRYTAYGEAFVALLNELNDATFARTQEMVESAKRSAFFFETLALATAVLFGLIGVFGMIFVLHGVKAAMEKEREAHALTQAILESAPFVISLWDENYNLVTVSQQAAEMFGLSDPKEMMGYMPHTISPAYQPCGTPTMEKARHCIGKAYSEGYSRFEWMHQTTAGEPLPVEIIAKRFHRGGKDMLVTYTMDMREMKAAMQKEREAHELTQTILESAPFVIVLWDDNYNIITVSQQTTDVLKISDPQEILGNKFFNFCPACQPCGTPTLEKARQCLGKAYSDGYSQFEWMFMTTDGEPLPVEVFTKRFSRNGKDMLVSYTIDLRKMKAAMEKEREAHEMNEILINAAPFMINIWDDTHTLVSTSKQAVEMFGLSSQEQYIERFFEFAPKQQPCGADSKEQALKNLNQAFRDGQRVRSEWMHQTLNGEPLPTEKIHVRFMRQGKYMVAVYTVDLRPIKAAEAFTQKLLDNSPMFMEFWDEDNNLLDCNNRMVEVFGASSKAEFIKRFYDFTAQYQPCGTPVEEKNRRMIKLAVERGSSRAEWMFILPGGEELPTETTWVHITHQGKPMIIVYSQDLRPIKQEAQEKLIEMRRREIAEDESQAKTRFLARMSHEIRTPMNAVLGITEIQLQKEHSPSTEEAFLRIHSSSNMLLTIINDILDLSKVEAGKMEIIPEAYELASMIVDTVQLNIMRVGSKNIDFKLNVDEQLPSHLIGDELRIKQILNNILSNAFKYTHEGLVTLSIGMEETRQTADSIMLVLCVQDTGQGMTQDQINSLDIEFSRFNLSSNRTVEGSGLGMTITFQLVRMMEGNIKVESEKDGGSIFTVRIPQKSASSSILGKETAENLQNFEISQKSLRRMAKMPRIPMPYGRVLVVDDVESNLYVVKGLLVPYKIAVETVTDGYNAIEKIKAGEVYDIIFMDHMMPGMDGVEATKIIREMGYEHPIVALTANALKDVSEMFLNNGFSGFIPKPINLDQFNSYLLRYIRDKQAPEVIQAAEMQYADAESTGNLLDSLRESFTLDAQKAVDILDPLMEPLTQGQEFDKAELKNFVIQTHAMKSALYNIGQAELSKAAFVLETAGRTADMETLKAFAPRFLNDLKKIMSELLPPDIGQDADDEDMAFLKSQLNIIAQACEKLDLNTANSTLEKLSEKQCSKKTKELLKAISANLLYGDFDEAIVLANRAANTL